MTRHLTLFAALLALTACGAPGSPPDGEFADPAGHPGTEVDDPQLEPAPDLIPVPARCTLPRPGTQCYIPPDPVAARDLIVLAAYCPDVGMIEVTSEDNRIEFSSWAGFTCSASGLQVGAFNLDDGLLIHTAEDGSHVVCETGDKPDAPPRVTDVWRAVVVDGATRHVPSYECESGSCDFIDADPCELPTE